MFSFLNEILSILATKLDWQQDWDRQNYWNALEESRSTQVLLAVIYIVGGAVVFLVGLAIGYFIAGGIVKKRNNKLKEEAKKEFVPIVNVSASKLSYFNKVYDAIRQIDKAFRETGYDLMWATEMVYQMAETDIEEAKTEVGFEQGSNKQINKESQSVELCMFGVENMISSKRKFFGEPESAITDGEKVCKYDKYGILIDEAIQPEAYLLLYLSAKLAEEDINRQFGEKISRVY